MHLLNRFLILLFLASCTVLTACSSDDDEDTSTRAALIGTWVTSGVRPGVPADTDLRAFYRQLFENSNVSPEKLEEAIDEAVNNFDTSLDEYELGNEVWTFAADGSFTVAEGADTYSGTWTLDGNTLIADDGDEEIRAKVASITSSVLELQVALELGEVIDIGVPEGAFLIFTYDKRP